MTEQAALCKRCSRHTLKFTLKAKKGRPHIPLGESYPNKQSAFIIEVTQKVSAYQLMELLCNFKMTQPPQHTCTANTPAPCEHLWEWRDAHRIGNHNLPRPPSLQSKQSHAGASTDATPARGRGTAHRGHEPCLGGLGQNIFDIGHLYILPICIITADLQHQRPHMRSYLLFGHLFHHLWHPAMHSTGKTMTDQ